MYVDVELRGNIGLKTLDIPLMSDKTGKISEVFKVFDGATFTANNSCFIIDDLGTVLASLANDNNMAFDLEEVARLVHAIQVKNILDIFRRVYDI